MCEAAVTIITVPAASHEFNRNLIVIHVVPNLLKGAVQKEWRDGVADGHVTRLRETDRHPDHELFARSNINRPVGKVAPNIVQDAVAQIGRNQEEARVRLHSRVKQFYKILPH